MWFFGNRRGSDLIAKVTALQDHKIPKGVLGQFYDDLTTLDSKASGLLTIDTLFIAILLAYPSLHIVSEPKGHSKIATLIGIQLGLTVISAFLCMLIVRVAWRFYRWVPDAPTQASHFDDEIQRIANAIDDRTHFYQLAWFLTLIAFVMTLAWWSYPAM